MTAVTAVSAVDFVLGIDIAKETFDVALLSAAGKLVGSGQFVNGQAGFAQLLQWLKHHKAAPKRVPVHACLEATGRYGDALADYLDAVGCVVSVVNPARIKAYASSKLQRNKTDRQDARLIADFCATQRPERWTPPPPEQRQLQEMARHLETLVENRQRERNRLAAGIVSSTVRNSLEEHIAFLNQQIAALEAQINDHIDQHPDLKRQVELLDSIPGFGPKTAALFLAELPQIANFDDASQFAAHTGLTPKNRTSGSSVRRRAVMSKAGNRHLRTTLYFPAIVAARCSPALSAFAERLRTRGKSKMAVIGAVMHKLARIAFAILKSGQPFDPNRVSDNLVLDM